MATKTSAVINYTDGSNNKGTKSITDINSSATPKQITDFTKGLMNLTNDNYVSTNRIDKTELDTATQKTAVSLTDGLHQTERTFSMSTINNSAEVINLEEIASSGRLVCKNPNAVLIALFMDCVHKANGNYKWDLSFMRLCDGGTPMNVQDWTGGEQQYPDATSTTLIADTGDLVFYIEETDTHARSNDFTVHITA